MMIYGIYNARVSPGKKADQLEKIVMHLSSRGIHFTNYQETLSQMFQSQQAYNRKEYEMAIENAKECLLVYKRNELVLNAMLMYNLLITIYTDLKNYEMVNEYKYEKLCLLDDHQISKNIFA